MSAVAPPASDTAEPGMLRVPAETDLLEWYFERGWTDGLPVVPHSVTNHVANDAEGILDSIASAMSTIAHNNAVSVIMENPTVTRFRDKTRAGAQLLGAGEIDVAQPAFQAT